MRKTSYIIWQGARHQVLFDLMDQIKNPEAGNTVLYRLKDYSESHFSIEERYMIELAYPGQDEHLRAHNHFRSEVGKLLTYDEPDAIFREIISTFLTEWLTRHVFGTDKKLEVFILKSSASFSLLPYELNVGTTRSVAVRRGSCRHKSQSSETVFSHIAAYRPDLPRSKNAPLLLLKQI